MADYLAALATGMTAHKDLKDRFLSGSVREEVEFLTRGELERAYIDVVGKYVDLTEAFFKRLHMS